ncbi:MAG: NERD domain-containing protein [Spirochaetes bacterium]|uniref:NERD domain-containing protein n=1 Tax=Candidatus Ornithospirochaeta stercoripullorum TaxID=2840899 RepID=A0A9D9E0I8_9SPIO|nr:NERD domain-containing protein [Candidatus Ornithospirochaeta stercoripullorum]
MGILLIVSIIIILLVRMIAKSSDSNSSQKSNCSPIRFTESVEEKGRRGELEVFHIVDWICASIKAIPMRNLYLPWPDGSTSQIDELIIAPSGIYVIEMKNYKGWIFGNENNQYWTQVLYKGTREGSTKNRLYNPIRQNASHISCLRKNLKWYKGPIHSLIVFSDEAEFKDVTFNSLGVYVLYESNLNRKIREIDSVYKGSLSENEINDIRTKLLQLSYGTDSTHHVEKIYQRLAEKEERLEKGLCPRCGAPLVVRTAKKGPNSGSRFLGCSRYPDCRYTRNID